ncbi:MAG: hypothetical protein L0Y66_15860 [Myxococcaceae bacterium]|nr:hypothetical protein [Myxococcaceae bacterium]
MPTAAILLLQLTAELTDGGTQPVSADDDGTFVLEPAQVLLVTSNVPVSNYRIRLLDESERALASDDTAEAAADGTLRYRIQLAVPLVPGSRYTLIMDSQSGTAIEGLQDRTFDELRMELQTTGEKPPPPPKPGRRRRR